MEVIHWVRGHGFDVLEGIGIVASLLFAAIALRKDEKSRELSTQLAFTTAHRDIWTKLYERPDLARILDPAVSLKDNPITNEEALFITFLLLHLNTAYRGIRSGMFVTKQALEKDICWFLALPIPNTVWQRSKSFLEPDFVTYVDSCLPK